MKKNILLLLALAFINTTFAQCKKEAMPEEGYWVIENNVKTPKHSIVYFYNRSGVMMYKQAVEGKKLNVARRKVVRQLNAVLFQSLTAWNNKSSDKNDDMIVKKNK